MPRHPFMLLLAVLISSSVWMILGSQRLVSYGWSFAHNEILGLDSFIESIALGERDLETSVDAINSWLAGKLPETHPVAHYLGELPGMDPWGRPYRCVRMDEPMARFNRLVSIRWGEMEARSGTETTPMISIPGVRTARIGICVKPSGAI